MVVDKLFILEKPYKDWAVGMEVVSYMNENLNLREYVHMNKSVLGVTGDAEVEAEKISPLDIVGNDSFAEYNFVAVAPEKVYNFNLN